jgi:hypothetical protein
LRLRGPGILRFGNKPGVTIMKRDITFNYYFRPNHARDYSGTMTDVPGVTPYNNKISLIYNELGEIRL